MEIDPTKLSNPELLKLLQSGINPRPIALASTIDKDGNVNLSPFSFYNVFGINPTTIIFSPARRGRDNTSKHTLDNVKEVPEVVINVVNYNMVQQISLSSTEYPKGVNEFEKAGFTAVESLKVKPPRVKESPLQFECKVREIIETSGKAGSGNLVICELLYAHADENIYDANGNIHPDKIDLVGRLGGDYYTRTSGNANFIVQKPISTLGIGVDSLPESIRFSKVLTGNDLGILGNVEALPDKKDLIDAMKNPMYRSLAKDETSKHNFAKKLITENKVMEALKVLLLGL
ncbi:MAG: flavin reductase family protein [Chlorobi bacterium]|nr:flavin reductase family protein [Chlorobiota bacterium]